MIDVSSKIIQRFKEAYFYEKLLSTRGSGDTMSVTKDDGIPLILQDFGLRPPQKKDHPGWQM